MRIRVLLAILVTLMTSACGGSKWPSRDAKSHEPVQSVERPQQSAPAGQQPARSAMASGDSSVPPATEMKNPQPPTAGTPGGAAVSATPRESSKRTVQEALGAVAGVKPELSVAAGPIGEPVLQIRYPWSEFPRPSLQMAWTDSQDQLAALQPIALDGRRAESLWQDQVNRINDPTYPGATDQVKTSLTFLEHQDGRPVTLRAHANALGKESAYAIDDVAGRRLVFYLLNCWADETGIVKIAVGDLDLATNLTKPGKLRVWFLSEEQPVWSEVLDWPGMQSATPVAGGPGGTSPGPMLASEQSASAPPSGASSATKGPTVAPQEHSPPVAQGETAQAQPPEQPTTSAVPDSAGSGPREEPTATPQSDTAASGKAAGPKQTEAAAAEQQPRLTSSGAADLQQMDIRTLVITIEKQFKPVMSREVRKFWLMGVNDYYRGKNPMTVRRNTFMDMLRDAYEQKPPKELQHAFRVLFFKLDAEQNASAR